MGQKYGEKREKYPFAFNFYYNKGCVDLASSGDHACAGHKLPKGTETSDSHIEAEILFFFAE